MNEAKDWVAEHVMGFERGNCWSTTSSSSSGSDGTFETWFDCDWCGQTRYDGKTGPCPKYPFPKFTLVDLMQKLGEKGYHVIVRIDPERSQHRFTVVLNSYRVDDTDEPLEALCDYFYYTIGGVPYHGSRKPKKKRFVSGEQVLEEYVPGYERWKGMFDWGY